MHAGLGSLSTKGSRRPSLSPLERRELRISSPCLCSGFRCGLAGRSRRPGARTTWVHAQARQLVESCPGLVEGMAGNRVQRAVPLLPEAVGPRRGGSREGSPGTGTGTQRRPTRPPARTGASPGHHIGCGPSGSAPPSRDAWRPQRSNVLLHVLTHIMYASAWRRYASSWRRGACSSGSRLDESCTRCIGDAASEPVILC